MTFYESLAFVFSLSLVTVVIASFAIISIFKWFKTFLIKNVSNRAANFLLSLSSKDNSVHTDPIFSIEGVDVLLPEDQLGVVENPSIIDQAQRLDLFDWSVLDTPTARRRGIIIY